MKTAEALQEQGEVVPASQAGAALLEALRRLTRRPTPNASMVRPDRPARASCGLQVDNGP